MAKRRKVVTEYEPEDEREAVAFTDPSEDSYSAFIQKFGQEGVRVKVRRQTAQGKEYCFFGSPAEIDEETIRLYHAKQSYAGEAGLYFCDVYVHGEFRSSFNVPIAPQIATPGAAAPGGSGSYDVIRLLQEQNARLEQRLMMQQNQDREREPINAIADAMVKMDSLRGGAQPRELPLEALIKAVELGKTLGGEASGDWKVLLIDAVKESMPAITHILSNMSKPAPAAAIQAGGSGSGGSGPTHEQGADMGDSQDEFLFKQAIDFLKRKALSGSDPGLYIDWVIDNADAPIYQKLIHRIAQSDFPAFAAIDPDISKPEYAPFFRAIFDGLRQTFVKPDPVADDSGRTSGDKGNAGRNGAASKGGSKKH